MSWRKYVSSSQSDHLKSPFTGTPSTLGRSQSQPFTTSSQAFGSSQTLSSTFSSSQVNPSVQRDRIPTFPSKSIPSTKPTSQFSFSRNTTNSSSQPITELIHVTNQQAREDNIVQQILKEIPSKNDLSEVSKALSIVSSNIDQCLVQTASLEQNNSVGELENLKSFMSHLGTTMTQQFESINVILSHFQEASNNSLCNNIHTLFNEAAVGINSELHQLKKEIQTISKVENETNSNFNNGKNWHSTLQRVDQQEHANFSILCQIFDICQDLKVSKSHNVTVHKDQATMTEPLSTSDNRKPPTIPKDYVDDSVTSNISVHKQCLSDSDDERANSVVTRLKAQIDSAPIEELSDSFDMWDDVFSSQELKDLSSSVSEVRPPSAKRSRMYAPYH
ncbi:hypothetical protein GEMRC1_013487 [Eukaryota sp. GEM-RC1]